MVALLRRTFAKFAVCNAESLSCLLFLGMNLLSMVQNVPSSRTVSALRESSSAAFLSFYSSLIQGRDSFSSGCTITFSPPKQSRLPASSPNCVVVFFFSCLSNVTACYAQVAFLFHRDVPGLFSLKLHFPLYLPWPYLAVR